jgi:hypothetical protein
VAVASSADKREAAADHRALKPSLLSLESSSRKSSRGAVAGIGTDADDDDDDNDGVL